MLINKGHTVTVISSNPEKQQAIAQLGATAAIGTVTDASFLAATFAGADAVYCMIPFDFKESDQEAYFRKVAQNYIDAIRKAGVKRVINLSGWAVELVHDNLVEKMMNELTDVAVTHMRPASFYSNFYSAMSLIKGNGMMGWMMGLRYYGLGAFFGRRGLLLGNYGGNDRIVLVAPEDIAAAVAEELEAPMKGKKIRYVGSDEMTCNEAAHILGAAIGKPWMKWVRVSDKQMQKGLKMAGMPSALAATLVRMQAAIHDGTILKKYDANRPVLGKIKLKDFAKEFAAAYL